MSKPFNLTSISNAGFPMANSEPSYLVQRNQSQMPFLQVFQGEEFTIQRVEEISKPATLDQVHEMHEKARSLSSESAGTGYRSAEERDKLDKAVRILNAAINLENTLTANPSDFGIEELKDSDHISGLKKAHWLRFDRGMCHLMLGNYEKAVEDFTIELSLHENGAGVYRTLYEKAYANKMMGKNDLALADFTAAKNVKGVDPQIIESSDFEIAEINSKNTILNGLVETIRPFRSFVTSLSVPASILGLQKPIEDKFLQLGEEKIGRILNQVFDVKKTDSAEFSQFLEKLGVVAKNISYENSLLENLQKVFDLLSKIKGSASPDSGTGSEDFINLFEKNTRKAYADKFKSPSSEVKSLKAEKIIRDRGNEL
jgi:tetratricopeptide (TPR) repeat protein